MIEVVALPQPDASEDFWSSSGNNVPGSFLNILRPVNSVHIYEEDCETKRRRGEGRTVQPSIWSRFEGNPRNVNSNSHDGGSSSGRGDPHTTQIQWEATRGLHVAILDRPPDTSVAQPEESVYLA